MRTPGLREIERSQKRVHEIEEVPRRVVITDEVDLSRHRRTGKQVSRRTHVGMSGVLGVDMTEAGLAVS